MTIRLQIILVIVSLIAFLIILKLIKRSRLNSDIATVWIIWGIGIIIISVFPQIIYFIGDLLGILAPINTIFLIMIFLLFMTLFYLCIKISILDEKVKNIAHELALSQKVDKDSRNGISDE